MVGTPLLQKPAERPSGSSLGLNCLLAASESVTRPPRIPDDRGSLDPLFAKCRMTPCGNHTSLETPEWPPGPQAIRRRIASLGEWAAIAALQALASVTFGAKPCLNSLETSRQPRSLKALGPCRATRTCRVCNCRRARPDSRRRLDRHLVSQVSRFCFRYSKTASAALR